MECGFTLKRVRDMIRTYSECLCVCEEGRSGCEELMECPPLSLAVF